jgi:uncharacterized membrane protein
MPQPTTSIGEQAPPGHGPDRRRRRGPAPAAVRSALFAAPLLVALGGGGGGAGPTAPPSSPATVSELTLATPYPAIDTQPGSTVRLDVDVSSPDIAPVDLSLDGVPDGWRATLRGGGFVIHAVTAAPDAPVTAELEIDVAPDAAAGEYPITITGTSGSETAKVDVTLRIADQVDSGIELTADFPSLRGEPATDFTYKLTITNNTPEEQTFTFDPSGPQGWTVSASPTAEARAETVTIDAGGTGQVTVTATPPESAEEGEYPIDVTVTAANGATGKIELTAEVTGTPQLELTTADQRLDVSGSSNSEHRIPLIIANSGTATLEDIKLAGTAPTGWDVSFDPEQIASVKPNETAQATAIVKPASDAVAGDYALTIRASAGSQSSSLDLRYSLKGSRTLGYVSLGVIAAAVATLALVFVRFGRR